MRRVPAVDGAAVDVEAREDTNLEFGLLQPLSLLSGTTTISIMYVLIGVDFANINIARRDGDPRAHNLARYVFTVEANILHRVGDLAGNVDDLWQRQLRLLREEQIIEGRVESAGAALPAGRNAAEGGFIVLGHQQPLRLRIAV